MPLDTLDFPLPPFRSRFPWFGGHLQTLANNLPFPRSGNVLGASERIEVPLRDGSGDVLLTLLDRASEGAAKPLIVLVHGLIGCERSAYMIASAQWFLARGHNVLRANLRGAGPSRAVCRQQYHPGSSADIWALLRHLPGALTEQGAVLIGFSLGGSIVLKYLGEAGSATPVVAAATVCAPLDLAAAAANLQRPRNLGYQSYFLAHMKREALAEGAHVDDGERACILAAQSVMEFDDRFTARRHGYDGATTYYAANSPLRFLRDIEVPTLCIAAADDPCVPAETYAAARRRASSAMRIVVAEGGGHIGFHDAADAVPWHDRAIAAFIERLG